MGKAYRYVYTVCRVCKNKANCRGWRRIERNEAIDYGTLKVMANCDRWDPEKRGKEGEK